MICSDMNQGIILCKRYYNSETNLSKIQIIFSGQVVLKETTIFFFPLKPIIKQGWKCPKIHSKGEKSLTSVETRSKMYF